MRLLSAVSIIALAASPALADSFNRIASFPVVSNMAPGEDIDRVTSAEIISASEDGNTLIYTDSPLGVVGLIDITDPTAPKPLGVDFHLGVTCLARSTPMSETSLIIAISSQVFVAT